MKSKLAISGDKMLAKKADESYAKVLAQDTAVCWPCGS